MGYLVACGQEENRKTLHLGRGPPQCLHSESLSHCTPGGQWTEFIPVPHPLLSKPVPCSSLCPW